VGGVTITVGCRVSICRPAGEYRAKGDDKERWHPSYYVTDEPVEVVEVRPANARRTEPWAVVEGGRAFPLAWLTEVEPCPILASEAPTRPVEGRNDAAPSPRTFDLDPLGPRSDSGPWRDLLGLAYQRSPELWAILDGMRSAGAGLARTETAWRIVAGEIEAAEYRSLAERWLGPWREELKRLMKEVRE
jgi:hypothetical protein